MWSWKLGNAFNEISPFNHLLITVVSDHGCHCYLSTADSALVVNVIINLNLILDPANIVSFKSKSISFFGIIKLVPVKARIATVLSVKLSTWKGIFSRIFLLLARVLKLVMFNV